MFSTCSELTPRAPIPDGRMAQFMQPWCQQNWTFSFIFHVWQNSEVESFGFLNSNFWIKTAVQRKFVKCMLWPFLSHIDVLELLDQFETCLLIAHMMAVINWPWSVHLWYVVILRKSCSASCHWSTEMKYIFYFDFEEDFIKSIPSTHWFQQDWKLCFIFLIWQNLEEEYFSFII